jgi:hypothetical protein
VSLARATPNTRTMFVWCNRSADRASFQNRSRNEPRPAGKTLSAKQRPSDSCSASYTTPIPPQLTFRTKRDSPSRSEAGGRPWAALRATP